MRISESDTDEFESRAHPVLSMYAKKCKFWSDYRKLHIVNYQYLPVIADFSHSLSITLYFFCEICKFPNEFKGWYAEIGNVSQINKKICI